MSAVDSRRVTTAAASIEARHAQGIVRQHLAHDRGEPWQCGVESVRDGELAEQFERPVEVCVLKIRAVDSDFPWPASR